MKTNKEMLKSLIDFSNELQSENDLIDKVKVKCESPLRYLELKVMYESNRITIRKLDEKIDSFK